MNYEVITNTIKKYRLMSKKYILLLFVASLCVLSSCEKKAYVSIGFNSEIENNSTGLNVFHVSHFVDEIYMVGTVNLTEGAVVVQLIDPNGDIEQSDTVVAPEIWLVDRCFNPKTGFWKLSYESLDGMGDIDLQIIY